MPIADRARQWHAAREHGDHETAERLAKWIDLRLDERRAIR
ncbi:hypothetical protein [Catellatospora chokoriensis]|nr:hypothetical protein [Catellatospora chokoriensis]